jgi:hypothetical protein
MEKTSMIASSAPFRNFSSDVMCAYVCVFLLPLFSLCLSLEMNIYICTQIVTYVERFEWLEWKHCHKHVYRVKTLTMSSNSFLFCTARRRRLETREERERQRERERAKGSETDRNRIRFGTARWTVKMNEHIDDERQRQQQQQLPTNQSVEVKRVIGLFIDDLHTHVSLMNDKSDKWSWNLETTSPSWTPSFVWHGRIWTNYGTIDINDQRSYRGRSGQWS